MMFTTAKLETCEQVGLLIDIFDRSTPCCVGLTNPGKLIYLVTYLVRPPGKTTSQRDQGLADLVHEEAHPVVHNPT